MQEDVVISSLYEGKSGVIPYNNVMKVTAGNRLTNFLCSYIEEVIETEQIEYGGIGPTLLKDALVHIGLENTVVPYDYFNPYTYTDIERLVYKPVKRIKIFKEYAKDKIRPIIKKYASKRQITSNTFAIHFFNLAWREKQLDKNVSYSKYCYFEKLKKRYL